MLFTKNNLYNPFVGSDLGFFITYDLSISKENLMMLTEIDLYHQPVENPIFGVVFLLFGIITLIVGEIAHFKLYKMVAKENGLVKETTQIYVLVQMIGYPILFIIISLTDFIHPLSQFVSSWFCLVSESFAFFYLFHILQHSIITAMMRYLFIVHEDWVKKHGKNVIKRYFLVLTICMPILMVVWDTCENFLPVLFVSRCNGVTHNSFLHSLPTLNNINTHCKESGANELFPGLFYIRKGGCIIKILLFAAIGLNVLEGFLYYKIFSHMKR